MPLLRISQHRSDDLYSVTEYYSSELEAYVRSVLEVIPATMFEILNRIITVQKMAPAQGTTDAAWTNRNFATSRSSASGFNSPRRPIRWPCSPRASLPWNARSWASSSSTPRSFSRTAFENSSRSRVGEAFHKELVFTVKEVGLLGGIKIRDATVDEFEARLAAPRRDWRRRRRRSFEYIQDYVNIYGLRVWKEETFRVVAYNVEQECNTFLTRGHVQDWQSSYQSVSAPIPVFAPTDAHSVNFTRR